MELRTAASPRDVKTYDTERLREEFLIQNLFVPGEIKLVYSHIDRIITGAAVPTAPIKLTAGDELRAQYFCERRELGLINIGEPGVVSVDGKRYEVGHKDGMYIGMGSKDIVFESKDASKPAKFYLNSAPAHKAYPTKLIKLEGTADGDDVVIIKPENKVELGSLEESNHRVINKYILPGQVESCQLVMGIPAVCGTRCPATPTTAVWKCISILRSPRTLSSYTTWASRRRRATSSCTTRRLSSPRAGRSTRAAAAGTTPLSGAWSVRIRRSTIWTA